MADPVWVDGTTPLNSVNMTKLQTRDEKGAPSGYVGLDSGSNATLTGYVNAARFVSNQAAGGFAFRNFKLVTDTQAAFQVFGDGTVSWGAGGTTAPDTTLYRSAAGTLRTNGPYFAITNDSGSLYFGTADDTSLSRYGAGILYTPGAFYTANVVSAAYNTARQVVLGSTIIPGGGAGINFGSAGDTNLYRSAANQLKTDGSLLVGGGVYLGGGTDTSLFRVAGNIVGIIGSFQSQGALTGWGFNTLATGDTYTRSYLRNDGTLLFGSGTAAPDTNLYRAAVSDLRTDGSFMAGTHIQSAGGGANRIMLNADGHIYFGGAADTTLYRSSANTLRTDGVLNVGGDINSGGGFSSHGIICGGTLYIDSSTAIDGNSPYWYKSAALQMTTNASLVVGGSLYLQSNAGTPSSGILFGTAQDVNLYRSTTGVLRCDGTFQVIKDTGTFGLSSLQAFFSGIGTRALNVGPPDSGGAGYRQIIITN